MTASTQVRTCVQCGAPARPRTHGKGPWPKYCESCKPAPTPEKLEYHRKRNRRYYHKYTKDLRAQGRPSYGYERLTVEQKAKRLSQLKAMAETPNGRQRMQERREATALRRRARKAGVDAEKFMHLEVYERDGWICGLCGTPVDQDLKYPHWLSASLDHIIPLSRGGAHTKANTQLAHLDCNMYKGARIIL